MRKLYFKLKSPRSNFGSEYIDSGLFIAGGFNGKEIVNNFEVFDKKLKTWSDLNKMPYKKKDFSFVAGTDKNIYAIGGTDDKE